MGRERAALALLEVEDEDVELALGGHGRILLTERAGGRVARILEGLLVVLLLLTDERGEALARHIDLAAHLEQGQRLRERERDAAHGAQIRGHVLTDGTVAAGRADGKAAVAVFERDGQAVDLRLHTEPHVRDLLPAPCRERRDLLKAENVLEAQHPHVMRDLLEAARRRTADALGGRIGREQLRERALEVGELVHEQIIGVVVHGGGVQHIVFLIISLEQTRQLCDTRLCLGKVHLYLLLSGSIHCYYTIDHGEMQVFC